jgi:SAM-dependent methyltransferase
MSTKTKQWAPGQPDRRVRAQNVPFGRRATDPYRGGFADRWDELVGWKKRAAADKGFVLGLLRRYRCERILDVALGTGFHTIELMKEGLSVKALDVSQSMIDVAVANAAKHSVQLDVVCSDWVDMDTAIQEEFDCILCLGNSLACENDFDKRQAAVRNWSEALTDDGIVIVDRRNYEALLAGEYSSGAKGQYFGDVKIDYTRVDKGGTLFSYTFSDGRTFTLQMFPIVDEEIRAICRDAGLEAVEVYGDRQLSHSGKDVAFYTYVFKKKQSRQ